MNCKSCIQNNCMSCFDDGWVNCGLPFSIPILPNEPNLFEKYKNETGINIEELLKPDYFATNIPDWAMKAKASIDAEVQFWAWYDTQPEVIAWEADCKRIRESKNTFCEQGLNKPGTLVEAEWNGEVNIILIGHVNTFGDSGLYNDPFLQGDAIIKRYKVIWSEG